MTDKQTHTSTCPDRFRRSGRGRPKKAWTHERVLVPPTPVGPHKGVCVFPCLFVFPPPSKPKQSRKRCLVYVRLATTPLTTHCLTEYSATKERTNEVTPLFEIVAPPLPSTSHRTQWADARRATVCSKNESAMGRNGLGRALRAPTLGWVSKLGLVMWTTSTRYQRNFCHIRCMISRLGRVRNNAPRETTYSIFFFFFPRATTC